MYGLLERHTVLRLIAGNTGWLMLDRVVRMLVGVMVGAWVARHLGPSLFGELAYALAFISIFQTATSLGLDLVLARDLPKHPSQAHLLLGTVLRLRLCAGMLGVLVASVTMTLLRPGDTRALLLTVILACGLLLQPADLVDIWFQARTQSRRAVLPRLIAYGISSAGRIALILNNAPLWAFAAIYLVEASVTAALLNVSYRALPVEKRWRWDSAMAVALLKQAWPMLVSALAIILYMRIDQILLRSIAGVSELGLYSAVLPFSQAWHFIPSTLCASATPFLVRLFSENETAFRRRVQQLFSILVWLSIAICLVVALLSGWIVGIFLGPVYNGADVILSIHVFSNIPVFLGVAQVTVLVIMGRTRVILIQTMTGVCVSVMLNLLLIPHYGALGSAIACVLAFSTSAVLCNFFVAPDVFRMQIKSFFTIHAK